MDNVLSDHNGVDWNTPQTPLVRAVVTTAIQPEVWNSIIITGEMGEPLVTLQLDGRVEFGSNYNPTEAAKAFWQMLGDSAPCKVK